MLATGWRWRTCWMPNSLTLVIYPFSLSGKEKDKWLFFHSKTRLKSCTTILFFPSFVSTTICLSIFLVFCSYPEADLIKFQNLRRCWENILNVVFLTAFGRRVGLSFFRRRRRCNFLKSRPFKKSSLLLFTLVVHQTHASRSVWPDWAIFEKSWWHIFSKKKPKLMITFWAKVKSIIL